MRPTSLICSLFLLLSFCSCTEEVPTQTNKPDGLRFIVPDFQYDHTSRTTLEITDEGAAFTWSANDTIGIFPDVDASQARFLMISGAGTQQAVFDGGGWALKESNTYAAYYPYIADIDLDKNDIPVFYTGQKQSAGGNTSHLSPYSYMAAVASLPEDGNVTFEFKHLSCLLQLKLVLPKPGTFQSVTLQAVDGRFIEKGSYDLMKEPVSIVPDVTSPTMSLALENIRTTGSNEEVLVYLMLCPVDLSGSLIQVSVTDDSGNTYQCQVNGRNFVSGKAYSVPAVLEAEADEDESGVHVEKAGSLEELLGQGKFQMTSLVVSGELNSDDIALLRRMSGGYRDTTDVEFGVLEYLDMEKVSIVPGGSYYLDNGDKRYSVRSKDAIHDHMFEGCHLLETLILPQKTLSIGEAAFSSCYGLTEMIVPEGVVSLGVSSFNSCKNLTRIVLPSSLTTIESDAFHSCSSLLGIEIPSAVTAIASNTFGHCKSLKEIILPEGLESIGSAAFAACNSLENLVLPQTLQTLGERSFTSCASLKQISFSSSMTTIPSYAFENCTALEKIELPEGMKSVASRAFSGCTNITEFVLPATLEELGERAFYAVVANSAIVVKCKASTPPALGKDVWKGATAEESLLYVPAGATGNYEESSWKNYFGSVKEIGSF